MNQSEAVRSSSKGVKFHYTDVIMSTIGAPNHQPHDCLLNCLLRRRSEKMSKLRVTGLCVHPGPGEFRAQKPVTQKMFPFDDSVHKRPVTQKMFPFDDSVHKRPVTQQLFPFDDVILHSNISFRIGLACPFSIEQPSWRSILMCNKSTSAGTSLESTPMFAHVTLHRTFNPLGSKCPWWQDEEAAS